MKKTGYFITCGAVPAAVGMRNWVGSGTAIATAATATTCNTQDKTGVVVGSKIRFGSSGGDPKWPRLHPKGQQKDTNKEEENDFYLFIYYTYY
jgi:hypothetical protein